jgi:hypothetical protein
MVNCVFGLTLFFAIDGGHSVERVSPVAAQRNGNGESGLNSLSNRGDFIATSSEDCLISIRDKLGRAVATHRVHMFEQGNVTALAFDP